MKIIGHPWIISEQFIIVNSIEEIKKTATGSIILVNDIEHSIELLRYCQQEAIPSAVIVESMKMSIFANLLSVRYIIASEDIVSEVQTMAQHYLFDTQILVQISKESDIERYAKMGIDGVIFSAAIIQMEQR